MNYFRHLMNQHRLSQVNSNYRDPFATSKPKPKIVKPTEYFLELLTEDRRFERQYGYTRRHPVSRNGGWTVEWEWYKGKEKTATSDWWKFTDTIVDGGVAYLRLEPEIYNIMHVKILYVPKQFGGQGVGRRAMQAINNKCDATNKLALNGHKFTEMKYFEDDEYLAMQLCPNPMDASAIIPPRNEDWTDDGNFTFIRDETNSPLGKYNEKRLDLDGLIQFYQSCGYVRCDKRRYRIETNEDGKRVKVKDMTARSFHIDRPVMVYPESNIDRLSARWV
jgi:GNAT superfamily N-acetyltransferase